MVLSNNEQSAMAPAIVNVPTRKLLKTMPPPQTKPSRLLGPGLLSTRILSTVVNTVVIPKSAIVGVDSIKDVCQRIKNDFEDHRRENSDLRVRISNLKSAINKTQRQTADISLQMTSMHAGLAFYKRKHDTFAAGIDLLDENKCEVENASLLFSKQVQLGKLLNSFM